MSRRRAALGDPALHLVPCPTSNKRRGQTLRRKALRRKIEEASVRPTPGSSDLLAQALGVTESWGYMENGKLGPVETHDLTAMAPVHLLGHPLRLADGRANKRNERRQGRRRAE